MSKQFDDRFVFVDLETTGLDPKGGLVLEVAVVITDAGLNQLDAANFIGAHNNEALDMALDDYTLRMHTENGLLKDVGSLAKISTASVGVTHTILDAEILAFLQGHCIENAPLAGSSVHFDRAWINEHLPLTAGLFHYRNIDVSSMREALKRINPRMNPNIPQVGTAHRAMGDILTTIETLRVIAKISGWRY